MNTSVDNEDSTKASQHCAIYRVYDSVVRLRQACAYLLLLAVKSRTHMYVCVARYLHYIEEERSKISTFFGKRPFGPID
jgi:hypothetical protein